MVSTGVSETGATLAVFIWFMGEDMTVVDR